jgi:trimeric autotransporter adhesin
LAGPDFQHNGQRNTVVGSAAGDSIKAGSQNTAIGSSALFGAINATASYNTAIGFQSLYSVTTAYGNVATGWQALYSNKVGAHNSATGTEALYTNTADFNTGTGSRALYTNSTGTSNTASGYATLYNNTSGNYNTALGSGALTYNSSGSSNVAIGRDAGANLTTGGNNIVIGASVLGKAGDANKIRIGKQGTQNGTFIAGIYNVAVPLASGIKPVYINSNGQLGTTPPASSARFKDAVNPMEKASEIILSLKPVTFRYKDDTEGTPQFGLIAEEVQEVDPDLVVRHEDGKVMTVRYEAINAMLLNEFLKEHRKVQELEKQLQTLTAALQQVKHQFRPGNRSPQRAPEDL